MSESPRNQHPKWPSPISVRVSWEEKQAFEKLSGPMPISRYIKEAILEEGKRPRASRKLAEPDREIIAKLLGVLGQSRLSSNINQLARAANSGSLPVNEDVIKALNEAADAILWIRDSLIQALGLKSQRRDNPDEDGTDAS